MPIISNHHQLVVNHCWTRTTIHHSYKPAFFTIDQAMLTAMFHHEAAYQSELTDISPNVMKPINKPWWTPWPTLNPFETHRETALFKPCSPFRTIIIYDGYLSPATTSSPPPGDQPSVDHQNYWSSIIKSNDYQLLTMILQNQISNWLVSSNG